MFTGIANSIEETGLLFVEKGYNLTHPEVWSCNCNDDYEEGIGGHDGDGIADDDDIDDDDYNIDYDDDASDSTKEIYIPSYFK